MRVLALAALLLLPALLVGCLGDPAPATPGEGGNQSGPLGAGQDTVDLDMAGCTELALLFIVDKARAQQALPEGFTAEEASAVLGALDVAPAGPDQGLIEVVTVDCQQALIAGGPHRWAGAYVLVEHPELSEHTPETPTFSLYHGVQYSQSSTEVEAYRSTGALAIRGNVTTELTQTPAGWLAAGSISEEGSQVLAYQAFVPDDPRAQAANGTTNRAWQAVPEGLVHTFYEVRSAHSYLGSTATCEVATGSHLHDILGTTSCTGERVLAGLSLQLDWQARLTHLPGATLAS